MSENVYGSDPSDDYDAVTPSDSVDFPKSKKTRGIYVGGAGDVVAVDPKGRTATFSSVPAGTFLPIVCKRINSTSTTATNLVALF